MLAVLLGGYWTYRLHIQNRFAYPKAEATTFIVSRMFGNEHRWIHVQVGIRNLGTTKIPIREGYCRLQQCIPEDPLLLAYLATGRLQPVFTRKADRPESDQYELRTEVEWPQIDKRPFSYPPGRCVIEPGEIEYIHFDFFVSNLVEVVYVEAYIHNSVTSKVSVDNNWASPPEYSEPSQSAKKANEPRGFRFFLYKLAQIPGQVTFAIGKIWIKLRRAKGPIGWQTIQIVNLKENPE